MGIKRVLHPTDFSPSAGTAFKRAVEIARRYGAELHLINVVEQLGDDPIRGALASRVDEDAFRDRINAEVVRNLRNRAASVPDLNVVSQSLAGTDVAEEILRYADATDPHLIVLGTHGRRGFRRMMAGSVGMEVARRALRPVLLCPEDPTLEAEDLRTRVLVPVDFSEHSRLALAYARRLAHAAGGSIDVLHVVEVPVFPSVYRASIELHFKNTDQLIEPARRELELLNSSIDDLDVDARIEVRYGHVTEQVLQYADESDATLLVISTHGNTGLARFFLGSVSDRLIRSAALPILRLRTLLKPEPNRL